MAQFFNLTIVKKDINDAVLDYNDREVDAVFIDAGHTYEEVVNDIRKWKSKAKILLCGHLSIFQWWLLEQLLLVWVYFMLGIIIWIESNPNVRQKICPRPNAVQLSN